MIRGFGTQAFFSMVNNSNAQGASFLLGTNFPNNKIFIFAAVDGAATCSSTVGPNTITDTTQF